MHSLILPPSNSHTRTRTHGLAVRTVCIGIDRRVRHTEARIGTRACTTACSVWPRQRDTVDAFAIKF